MNEDKVAKTTTHAVSEFLTINYVFPKSIPTPRQGDQLISYLLLLQCFYSRLL